MPSAGPVRSTRGRLGIGQVLAELVPDFPDTTISKIRFLETEGLVHPERTASGYRKFSRTDVERLRYVLAAQRDHYLPLKVIRDHLDAMDRGLEPSAAAGGPATAAVPAPSRDDDLAGLLAEPRPGVRMSRAELVASSGLTDAQLGELMSFGLVVQAAGTDFFDSDALAVAVTLAAMAAFGLEPRHVRTFKTAADRQVGLIEQVSSPLSGHRDAEVRERATEVTTQLAALTIRLHAALVRQSLRRDR